MHCTLFWSFLWQLSRKWVTVRFESAYLFWKKTNYLFTRHCVRLLCTIHWPWPPTHPPNSGNQYRTLVRDDSLNHQVFFFTLSQAFSGSWNSTATGPDHLNILHLKPFGDIKAFIHVRSPMSLSHMGGTKPSPLQENSVDTVRGISSRLNNCPMNGSGHC